MNEWMNEQGKYPFNKKIFSYAYKLMYVCIQKYILYYMNIIMYVCMNIPIEDILYKSLNIRIRIIYIGC